MAVPRSLPSLVVSGAPFGPVPIVSIGSSTCSSLMLTCVVLPLTTRLPCTSMLPVEIISAP